MKERIETWILSILFMLGLCCFVGGAVYHVADWPERIKVWVIVGMFIISCLSEICSLIYLNKKGKL